MKHTIITHTAEWILLGIITILFCYTAYKSYQLKQKVEYITTTDTITVTDTITHLQPYDIHHYRTDTAYLPVIDTLLDTVTDSVFVELPISIYRYDTTVTDSNYTTRIQAVVEGFAVSLDTLSIHTQITRQEAILLPKQRRWGIGAGLMYGTGGFGLGVGVFYKLF